MLVMMMMMMMMMVVVVFLLERRSVNYRIQQIPMSDTHAQEAIVRNVWIHKNDHKSCAKNKSDVIILSAFVSENQTIIAQ